MSYPLGPRYVRPAARAKIVTLKPPTDTYFINVSVPPYVVEEDEPGTANFNVSLSLTADQSASISRRTSTAGLSPAGSAFNVVGTVNAHRGAGYEYSASVVNALAVQLHVKDTISKAIEKVVQRYKVVHERDLPRPAAGYMLCVCFADYSIDFAHRSLHGDSHVPLLQCLQFPYYLSLQVNPYQQRRDRLAEEAEPRRRQELREERRVFMLFALEYSAILRKMHQQYMFLLGRDHEARQAKKTLEVQARHDAEMRNLFRCERDDRAAIAAHEDALWATTSFEAQAIFAHCLMLDEQFRYSARELGSAYRRVRKHLDACDRLATLNARFHELTSVTFPRLEEASLAQRRVMYTEARVASGLQMAQATGEEVEIANSRRVLASRAMRPELYAAPDNLNSRAVLGDVYTSARSLI
jgi:hypothetical protein